MGQVTSVYDDEVIGKIFYSQSILVDLRRRDFSQSKQFKKENEGKIYLNSVAKSIQSIYGFSQSFCQGFLFSALIQKKQHLIYNNGRFVVKISKNHLLSLKQFKEKQQKMTILPHEDIIAAMDINQNLCAVGVLGGKLTVWDLKFNQIKIQLYLPKPSRSFTSLSITKKYIFVTDNSMPSNIAFCYDVQTTKLKSLIKIESAEPTLRGIRFQENHHVTVCADGLWFIRYSASTSQLQLTKGMFKQYPKTSQTSIANFQDKYLVSGGVDGYVYIWNSSYQCVKVLRFYDQEQQITSIAYNKQMKTMLVGSILGKVKIFLFDVKAKDSKASSNSIEQLVSQSYQDVQYSLSQAFQDEQGIQNILVSCEDKLLYFKFNHSGRMMSHLLPSSQPYPNKLKAFNNIEHIRYSRKGECLVTNINANSPLGKIQIHQNKSAQGPVWLKSIYPKSSSTFNMDVLKLCPNGKWWTIQQKLKIFLESPINQNHISLYTYCDQYECVAYLDQSYCVMISFLVRKNYGESNQQQTSMKSSKINSTSNQLNIMAIDKNFESISSINYLLINHKTQNHNSSKQSLIEKSQIKQVNLKKIILLIVTSQQKCHVFKSKSKSEYALVTTKTFTEKNKFTNFAIQIQDDKQQLTSFKQQHFQSEGRNSPIKIQLSFDQQDGTWKQYASSQQDQKIYSQVEPKINQRVLPRSKLNQENTIQKKPKLNQEDTIQNQQKAIQNQESNEFPSSQNSIRPFQAKLAPSDFKYHSSEQVQSLIKIHTSLLKDQYALKAGRITIGGSSVIIWKQSQMTIQDKK